MGEKATIYIETYGCANNQAESQIMAGILTREGYEMVKNPENSEILIINTCSVKATTVQKNLFRIMELKKKYPKKKIIVSGCLPETEQDRIMSINGISVLSTNHITKIAKVASEVIAGNNLRITGICREKKICLPKIMENSVIDIIPICSGCNSFCTYCATRIAKGSIFSYSQDAIIKEIDNAKSFGTKEFWLTGQEVSAYGLDENEKTMLPNLLEKITGSVKGKYFIRIGMINPANLLNSSNEMLRAFKSERIFKFLHIPVQSGSDSVLKRMGRHYKADDFREIIGKFRRHHPEMTIWTDFIVGFPGETDDDFASTMELLRETEPDFVNISQFSSHSCTPASRLKQVNSIIKKQRSRKMTSLAREIMLMKNMKWIGWSGEVLIDEYKRDKSSWIGRNYAYKPVVIRSRQKLMGKFVNVKIIDAKETCLFGEVV